MSDDELDKLFKEAAEGFKAPKDSSAWQDMARRLDQQPNPAPSEIWNWKTISIASFIGLTGIGVLWYTLQDHSANALTTEMASVENDQSVEDSRIVEGEAYQNLDKTLVGSDEKSASGTTPIIPAEGNSVKSPATNIPPAKNNLTSKPGSKAIEITLEDSFTEKVAAKKPGTTPMSLQDSYSSTEVYEAKKDQQESMAQSVLSRSGSELGSPIVLDSASKINEQKVLKDTTGIAKDSGERKSDKKGKESSVNVKLVVAPDFSSINFFSPDKSGFNYGLLIGYSFNNRWSVYSGAIYSKKIYSSDEINKSYTNSGGYDYEITELYGDCRVIDIPINTYYTFFPDRTFSIKAGLGFSSYIMLQEDYTYYVNNPYGPDEYQQSISNENNEWFKMLNVSIMLQKKLSNRFYLELEPFLKAPLAGVGEGEVSLVSMGAFFNLRFDIPIANKP